MGKFKPVAITMVIVMLVTMLASCSSAKKGDNVVKEDDPWYETTRIKLEKGLKPNEDVADAVEHIATVLAPLVACISQDVELDEEQLLKFQTELRQSKGI